MSRSKVIFGISGSVGAYKALTAISALIKDGLEVQCVGTPSALQFIGPASIEGLTERPFLTDVFATGQMMDHVRLARWADIFIVAPASAHTIAKLSLGLADDLLSTLFLALEPRVPKLLAPAMNPQMWKNAVVAENIAKLRTRGVEILEPDFGRTACGEIGEGRLIEPHDIVKSVMVNLDPPARHDLILVTSGGTTEPIDSVRCIANSSTGRTGAVIADELSRLGFKVVLVKAKSAQLPSRPVHKIIEYFTTADLQEVLQSELARTAYRAAIHAAAVSDFAVSQVIVDGSPVHHPTESKLPSGGRVSLHLSTNPKLIDNLKKWSRNKEIKIVGFKLTDSTDIIEQTRQVDELFKHSLADLIVQNDRSNVGTQSHTFRLFDKAMNNRQVPGVIELAREMGDFL